MVGGLGLIIVSNLNRVRLSCCWVGLRQCDMICNQENKSIECTDIHRVVKIDIDGEDNSETVDVNSENGKCQPYPKKIIICKCSKRRINQLFHCEKCGNNLCENCRTYPLKDQ